MASAIERGMSIYNIVLRSQSALIIMIVVAGPLHNCPGSGQQGPWSEPDVRAFELAAAHKADLLAIVEIG